MSANTWQWRGYPNSCQDTAVKGEHRKIKHVIEVEGHDTRTFQEGTMLVTPFELTAGEEINVFLEMDYNRPDMKKDVSVVVWGDKGEVCIQHKDGI